MTFRTRIFITSAAAAAVTLAVATTLVSWSIRRTLEEQIERSLVNARLFELYDALHAERLNLSVGEPHLPSAVTSHPLSLSCNTSRSNSAMARSTRCQS